MNASFWIDLPQARYPASGICTGGRPLPRHLHQARAAGVRTVVNLCSPAERCDFDERQLVEALGMRYLNIPIRGPADLCEANARRLAAVLEEPEASPLLIHCACGNRVGALMALKSHLLDGLPLDRSIAQGRSAGLSTLEVEVRCILLGR